MNTTSLFELLLISLLLFLPPHCINDMALFQFEEEELTPFTIHVSVKCFQITNTLLIDSAFKRVLGWSTGLNRTSHVLNQACISNNSGHPDAEMNTSRAGHRSNKDIIHYN